jgi:hypothetical protein
LATGAAPGASSGAELGSISRGIVIDVGEAPIIDIVILDRIVRLKSGRIARSRPVALFLLDSNLSSKEQCNRLAI